MAIYRVKRFSASPSLDKIKRVGEKIQKYEPSWGDGQEYPVLWWDEEEEELHVSPSYIYAMSSPGTWYCIFDKKRVPDLKKEILRVWDEEKEFWEGEKSPGRKDAEDVLLYLKKSREIIEREL